MTFNHDSLEDVFGHGIVASYQDPDGLWWKVGVGYTEGAALAMLDYVRKDLCPGAAISLWYGPKNPHRRTHIGVVWQAGSDWPHRIGAS